MAQKTQKPQPKPLASTDRRIANIQAQADQRLANLAMELGVAAAQVLREDYGFSEDMAAAFMAKMIARAKANRDAGAAELLAKWTQPK